MIPPRLSALGEEYLGAGLQVFGLGASGSHRRYFRMVAGGRGVIAVEGTDADENRAFIALSRHLAGKGVNVPRVLAVSGDGLAYLQDDLGDETLFDAVSAGRECGRYGERERRLLCETMAELPKIQFEGAEGLDWGVCWPAPAFDARTVDFDLNYFKYCYLKNTGIEFDEGLLQDDFDKLGARLLSEASDTFMYRDFQSRNVMLHDSAPWFIDFQGGRRGPIYYDVASFVWQARARYPEDLREELIDAYLRALGAYRQVDAGDFRERLRPFVLFRCLQTLGAYGFRGLVERKPHFLASIGPALDNLRGLLPTGYPYIDTLIGLLAARERPVPAAGDASVLSVEVQSFSYREGYPVDRSGNGGGFVFDCRGVRNPGRYEEYRHLTGRDRPVEDFLEADGGMSRLLDAAFAMVDPHVEDFLGRGFSHMQVSFGCTGGRHRSVYGAERMAAHLKSKYPDVRVVLRHVAQGMEEVL